VGERRTDRCRHCGILLVHQGHELERRERREPGGLRVAPLGAGDVGHAAGHASAAASRAAPMAGSSPTGSTAARGNALSSSILTAFSSGRTVPYASPARVTGPL